MPAQEQNCSVLDITLQFPNDIGMEFGLGKCRKVHLVRGEVDMQLGHEDKALIETMTEKDSYKYLGVLQLRDSLQTAIRGKRPLFPHSDFDYGEHACKVRESKAPNVSQKFRD